MEMHRGILLGFPSTRSRFLTATVRSTSSAWWLHHAHPFVAASEKSTFLMQTSKAFGHAVVVSKICYNTVISVIVLSVVLWDCCKPTNTCRDWAFSNSGLPAFQLPMFAKCDAAERIFFRHVCLRNPFRPLLFGIPSIHSLPEAWGSWERQYAPPVLHDGCIMPIPLLQLQKKAPVSCSEAEGLVTQLWSRRFVTIL